MAPCWSSFPMFFCMPTFSCMTFSCILPFLVAWLLVTSLLLLAVSIIQPHDSINHKKFSPCATNPCLTTEPCITNYQAVHILPCARHACLKCAYAHTSKTSTQQRARPKCAWASHTHSVAQVTLNILCTTNWYNESILSLYIYCGIQCYPIYVGYLTVLFFPFFSSNFTLT